MNLKNYTSTIDAAKSMAKVQELLVEIGAEDISLKYKDKQCVAITFLLYDSDLHQTIPFNLKVNTEAVFNVLWKAIKRPQPSTRATIQQQANRTAWKILSDWTEIQCSMIMLEQAKPLQLFLPFVYDVYNNETFYDRVISGKTKLINSPQ